MPMPDPESAAPADHGRAEDRFIRPGNPQGPTERRSGKICQLPRSLLPSCPSRVVRAICWTGRRTTQLPLIMTAPRRPPAAVADFQPARYTLTLTFLPGESSRFPPLQGPVSAGQLKGGVVDGCTNERLQSLDRASRQAAAGARIIQRARKRSLECSQKAQPS